MLYHRHLFNVLSDPKTSDSLFIKYAQRGMEENFFGMQAAEDVSLTIKEALYPILERMARLRPTYLDHIPLQYFLEVNRAPLYKKGVKKEEWIYLRNILLPHHVPYMKRYWNHFGLSTVEDIFHCFNEASISHIIQNPVDHALFMQYVQRNIVQKPSGFWRRLKNIGEVCPSVVPALLPMIQSHNQNQPETVIWEMILQYIVDDTFDDTFVDQLLHPNSPIYSSVEYCLFEQIRNVAQMVLVVSPAFQRLVDHLPVIPEQPMYLKNDMNRHIMSYFPDVHTVTEEQLVRLLGLCDFSDITPEFFHRKELSVFDAHNTEVYTQWMEGVIKNGNAVKATAQFLQKIGFDTWYRDLMEYKTYAQQAISLDLIPSHSLKTLKEVLHSQIKWREKTNTQEINIHL